MMAFTSPMFLTVKVAICSGVSPLLCIFRTIWVSVFVRFWNVMEYPALFIGLHP